MEFEFKLGRLRSWMEKKSIHNLLLTETHNFSWLTCGGENFVFFATNRGAANLLITLDQVVLISSNIETQRLYREELGELPIQDAMHIWHISTSQLEQHYKNLHSGEIVIDLAVENELKLLRDPLFPDEIERYRWLGQRAEEAIREACLAVRPGMTEYEAAALLSKECLSRAIWPGLLLVASDDRAYRYRHPVPTSKVIEKHAMMVVCARRYGLIASVTRMIYFGPVAADLRRKHDAVCRVDAALILTSRPGNRFSDVLRNGIAVYEETGFGEEWHLHHQGGATGYVGRSVRALPDSPETVQANQAVAWNPSIAGTKSEDTVLVKEQGMEILTQANNWPMMNVQYRGKSLTRCDIYEM